jgi:hypothetical protein
MSDQNAPVNEPTDTTTDAPETTPPETTPVEEPPLPEIDITLKTETEPSEAMPTTKELLERIEKRDREFDAVLSLIPPETLGRLAQGQPMEVPGMMQPPPVPAGFSMWPEDARRAYMAQANQLNQYKPKEKPVPELVTETVNNILAEREKRLQMQEQQVAEQQAIARLQASLPVAQERIKKTLASVPATERDNVLKRAIEEYRADFPGYDVPFGRDIDPRNIRLFGKRTAAEHFAQYVEVEVSRIAQESGAKKAEEKKPEPEKKAEPPVPEHLRNTTTSQSSSFRESIAALGRKANAK